MTGVSLSTSQPPQPLRCLMIQPQSHTWVLPVFSELELWACGKRMEKTVPDSLPLMQVWPIALLDGGMEL